MKYEKHLKQVLSKDISRNWDLNIGVRAQDIEDGTDITYQKVIIPWVIQKIHNLCGKESRILDVGCGCGYLANLIFSEYPYVSGIDISRASIDYARKKYPYIDFKCEDFCALTYEKTTDLILAVMTLNNLSNLNDFFRVAKEILNPNGKILIVIPHPCFWPIKHIKDEKFAYLEENFYQVSFSTKGRQDYPSTILYFHRPIEKYYEYIKKEGFNLLSVTEISEENKIEKPDLLGIIISKR